MDPRMRGDDIKARGYDKTWAMSLPGGVTDPAYSPNVIPVKTLNALYNPNVIPVKTGIQDILLMSFR